MWLGLSITLNLGLLAYFKYANFFVENLQTILQAFGMQTFEFAEVALPIGISFYTFQTLTYSIDIYRGNEKPLEKVQDYVLYIMMFPQLIAGPIVRFGDIHKQITHRVFKYQGLVEGFIRFCIGLGKKVLIANVLAETADQIFRLSGDSLSSSSAWLGLLCYTFQIYFDFSGYSDMAIGMGKMMGFRFPENFNSPYTSLSITRFWRKWHITLGTFMRDYLYLPLGGNRNGTTNTYRNLFIVFFLSGLWHGASWNFVLWGIYHGFFLIFERLTGLSKSDQYKLIRIPATFLIVMLGWVVFRADDIPGALNYYRALFAFDGLPPVQLYNAKLITILAVATFFSFITLTSFGRKWGTDFFESPYQGRKLPMYFIAAVILLTLSVSSLATGAFNPFIYFRF